MARHGFEGGLVIRHKTSGAAVAQHCNQSACRTGKYVTAQTSVSKSYRSNSDCTELL